MAINFYKINTFSFKNSKYNSFTPPRLVFGIFHHRGERNKPDMSAGCIIKAPLTQHTDKFCSVAQVGINILRKNHKLLIVKDLKYYKILFVNNTG